MSRHGGLLFLRYRRVDPMAKPRMLAALVAACARKPTNYFRVYKINERSVAWLEQGCLLALSLASLLLHAREHTEYAIRKRREREREKERRRGAFLNVFPRGGRRLCFP